MSDDASLTSCAGRGQQPTARHGSATDGKRGRTSLRVSRGWVYAETRREADSPRSLGRYVRYRRSAMTEWIAALERDSSSGLRVPLGEPALLTGRLRGFGFAAAPAPSAVIATVQGPRSSHACKEACRYGAPLAKRRAYYGRWRRRTDASSIARSVWVRSTGKRGGYTRAGRARVRAHAGSRGACTAAGARRACRASMRPPPSLGERCAGMSNRYRDDCERMQRVHLAPRMGDRKK